MFWVFFWTGVGNASTTEQMAVLFPPLQGGAVVGWTSAVGAYGPFTIGMLLAECGAGRNVRHFDSDLYRHSRHQRLLLRQKERPGSLLIVLSHLKKLLNWRTKCPES